MENSREKVLRENQRENFGEILTLSRICGENKIKTKENRIEEKNIFSQFLHV